MLNGIWLALILSSILCAAFTGRMEALQKGLIDAAGDAVKLVIGLVGVMAFFLGLMRVARDGGLLLAVARGLEPLMRRLFPEVPPEHPAIITVAPASTSRRFIFTISLASPARAAPFIPVASRSGCGACRPGERPRCPFRRAGRCGPSLNQDFRFGFLATANCTSNCLRWSRIFHLSPPECPQRPRERPTLAPPGT